MAFAVPKYEKSEINRAGKLLCQTDIKDIDDLLWAFRVLANWRACHGYPINTFQALLRKRIKDIEKNAIVAQRLKRAPSVISKLLRFSSMKLSQMQDIAGLRAIVGSVHKVRQLEALYQNSNFNHEFVSSKDYIAYPKADGYRSVHMVFRYNSNIAPEYNGLLLELQFRTKVQHAWATAVETMGTFLGQALKSGQGDLPWRKFFEVSSAALAVIEKSPPIPGYESHSREEIFRLVAEMDDQLHVLSKLEGFSIAAGSIREEKGAGSYHLIILDSSQRTVSIKPFPKTQLEQANMEYALIEERAQNGEMVEAVLVSAGPIEALKKAYPNYFLDTHEFVLQISKVIDEAKNRAALTKRSKRTKL